MNTFRTSKRRRYKKKHSQLIGLRIFCLLSLNASTELRSDVVFCTKESERAEKKIVLLSTGTYIAIFMQMILTQDTFRMNRNDRFVVVIIILQSHIMYNCNECNISVISSVYMVSFCSKTHKIELIL